MIEKYIERLFKEPETSYFLFGPRGTGKSTMVAHRHEDALLIDLRIADMRYQFFSNPDLLLEIVNQQPEGATIIIDEIQRVPELLSIIHILIEKKKKWKFILTGSGARKLKRQGVDLLGGRALNKVLYPFIAAELKEEFNLDDACLYGLLPLRFDAKNPREMLKAYVSLYLEEELRAEGLIRNIEPFARFLTVMSFSHGAILNVTNISKECHVQRTTVTHWLTILEELLLCYQLPIFDYRARRELTVHPKFYLFDAGIYHALRPQYAKDTRNELNGAALEGLVAQHLIAWNDYSSQTHTIAFWRTRSGVEIDFVVHGRLGFWAIEVKNSTTIHSSDIRGLTAFKQDYPDAKTILLYRGKFRLRKKDVLCLPCDEFLRAIIPDMPLDASFGV